MSFQGWTSVEKKTMLNFARGSSLWMALRTAVFAMRMRVPDAIVPSFFCDSSGIVIVVCMDAERSSTNRMLCEKMRRP